MLSLDDMDYILFFSTPFSLSIFTASINPLPSIMAISLIIALAVFLLPKVDQHHPQPHPHSYDHGSRGIGIEIRLFDV